MSPKNIKKQGKDMILLEIKFLKGQRPIKYVFRKTIKI